VALLSTSAPTFLRSPTRWHWRSTAEFRRAQSGPHARSADHGE
jgi:hypothetical protein